MGMCLALASRDRCLDPGNTHIDFDYDILGGYVQELVGVGPGEFTTAVAQACGREYIGSVDGGLLVHRILRLIRSTVNDQE